MQEDIYDAWSEGTPGSVDRWMTAFYGPPTRPLDEVVVHRSNSELYEFYHCFDPQSSTIAILGHEGLVRERIDYSAFGFAQHRPFADIDGDGIGSDDAIVSAIVNQCNGGTAVPIGHACYTAEADINRDGVIDYVSSSSDYALAGARSSTLAPGEISAASVHNIFGWNGAVFDAEGGGNGLYLMRFRHYSPVRQRWLQRDPAGYMDSANLYGYVAGNPIGWSDPYGLQQIGQAGEFVGSDPVQFGSGGLPSLGMLGELAIAGLGDIEIQDRLDPWKDIAMVDDPVFGMPSTWRMFRDGLEDAWTIWEGMCNRLLVNDPDVERAYQYTMAVAEQEGYGGAYTWSRRAMKTSLIVNPLGTGGAGAAGAAVRTSKSRTVATASVHAAVHGNSAKSLQVTILYGMYHARTGIFLKWGITSSWWLRYPLWLLRHVEVIEFARGSRSLMLQVERWLVEHNAGPWNFERWADNVLKEM